MALFREAHPGNVVLGVVAAALLYGGVLVTPHYLMKLDLAEAVGAVHPHSARLGDEELVRMLEGRTREFGTHMGVDEWGVEKEMRGLGLTQDNVTVDRNPITHEVRIEVRFVRGVRLVPTK